MKVAVPHPKKKESRENLNFQIRTSTVYLPKFLQFLTEKN